MIFFNISPYKTSSEKQTNISVRLHSSYRLELHQNQIIILPEERRVVHRIGEKTTGFIPKLMKRSQTIFTEIAAIIKMIPENNTRCIK